MIKLVNYKVKQVRRKLVLKPDIQAYNTKIITSGDKIEIYKYSGYILTGSKSRNENGRKGKDTVSKEIKKANTEQSKRQSLNKARQNIIRLISSNCDMNSFITLTYKENMQDIKKSKKDIKYFLKKLKKEYDFLKYLYVMEFQERGAIHFHLITNIKFNLVSVKHCKSQQHKDFESWFNKKFWNRGIIDIRNLKNDGVKKVSNYVASYLVQDLFDRDLQGCRCYAYSRNMLKPVVTKVCTALDYVSLMNTDENVELKFKSQYKREYIDKTRGARSSKVYFFEYEVKNNE